MTEQNEKAKSTEEKKVQNEVKEEKGETKDENIPVAQTTTTAKLNVSVVHTPSFHGYMGNAEWPDPRCVAYSDKRARDKHSQSRETASEFVDHPDVMKAKVNMLVEMILTSKNLCLYTGAGLSTAAGIWDYASKAKGTQAGKSGAMDCGNRLELQPTHSHRILAALEKSGHVEHWLQQNHDGLAQKAGFPFAKLNEIHGGWFDKDNPVVLMDGQLRTDLYNWMIEWKDKADMVIAMGTSLCGMSADCVADAVAYRHMNAQQGLGLVVINLQKTPCDGNTSLRIFGTLDVVLGMVAKKLKLKLDNQTYSAYPKPGDSKGRLKKRGQSKTPPPKSPPPK